MAISLAPLLTAIAGPLVKRALIALGIGTITYTGVLAGFNSVLNDSRALFNSLPVDLLNLANLIGMGQALGIIFGAFLALISLRIMKRIGMISV